MQRVLAASTRAFAPRAAAFVRAGTAAAAPTHTFGDKEKAEEKRWSNAQDEKKLKALRERLAAAAAEAGEAAAALAKHEEEVAKAVAALAEAKKKAAGAGKL